MKYKFFYVLVLFVFLFNIYGCSTKNNNKKQENILVTFKNYDDTVLLHIKIPYGSTASFNEDYPTREKTEDKEYTFAGWDKSLDTPLFSDTVFNAVYSEKPREYVVNFVNYDNTLLKTVKVAYGSIINYSGKIPQRNSDDERIDYQFDSWDKDLTNYRIINDTTFKAQFIVNEYVFATFTNYDGSLLQKIKIKKGSQPEYDGKIPERKCSDIKKAYKFIGWDNQLTSIFSDTIFTAKFDLRNVYTVTFKNYNDLVLETKNVISGDDVKYTASTPYKPSTKSGDYIYTYTFLGWSKSLQNITSDLEVIAQYDYTITVTGQTAIKDHLNTYGAGMYHSVNTGVDTTLGYLGSYYYLSLLSSEGTLYSAFAVNFTYGSSYGIGTLEINDNGICMYKATMKIYVSDHYYNRMELVNISVAKYTTEQQANLVAALSILYASKAIDNASNYLSDLGLPYIF